VVEAALLIEANGMRWSTRCGWWWRAAR
jgi:hypothetical protein